MEQLKGNNQNWTELLGIWIVTPLINVVVNWQLSKQGFHWPVSPDHTVGSSVNPSRSSIFLKLSADFPEGTQPSWKFTEIPRAGGYDKHPLQCIMEIPGGVEGGGGPK